MKSDKKMRWSSKIGHSKVINLLLKVIERRRKNKHIVDYNKYLKVSTNIYYNKRSTKTINYELNKVGLSLNHYVSYFGDKFVDNKTLILNILFLAEMSLNKEFQNEIN